MMLGRVVGTVWGAKEAQPLRGAKIVQVQPLALRPGPRPLSIRADDAGVALRSSIRLAVDELGAGTGEFVLVAHGSRVRDLTVGPDLPVKDVVIAIVDACDVDFSEFPEVMP